MITRIFFLSALLLLTLSAQDRVLLHIGQNGQQEAIPLKKGERAQDVIERLENAKATLTKSVNATGLIDTLKYFTTDGSLTTGFSYSHQDVAMQWYLPASWGKVKEFWWKNYTTSGLAHKATIRAWRVNPKVTTLPTNVQTKYLGYYIDPSDGDGLRSPIKPTSGNTWFYSNGASDSAIWNFDPLGTEVATWILGGGLQVSLVPSSWQGIVLENWGDSMVVALGQPFGFTLSNDTKKSDVGSGFDTTMTIYAIPQNNPAPYHSYKYYENGRLVTTPPTDGGWWLRGDYDWGMYVVIEYGEIPYPKITIGSYGTTLNPGPRKICATVRDDNPGGPTTLIAYLFYKFGAMSTFDSVQMIQNENTFCGEIPKANIGDTVYWNISVTDMNGHRTMYGLRTYKIFKKTRSRLFIYNNSAFSLSSATGGANYYYNNKNTEYDRWSTVNDGTEELPDLLALYDNVEVIDGAFPARNVYTSIKTWIATGTALSKKNFFLSSQDYGCYIQGDCADTSFTADLFENMYLGVTKIGPQDQGSTTRPVQFHPQADPVTNYIIKYNTDSATTIWSWPTYELGFSGYPDYIEPTGIAKALFKNTAGTGVYGVRNSGTTFNTAYMAFDIGTLQFRSDTTLAPFSDPKYRWIADVKSLANTFFDEVTDVEQEETKPPLRYSLAQNYPNPFNPSTTIEYSVAIRSDVKITIYNLLGQKVATVVNETKDAGLHTAAFNAYSLASGLYFYEMRAGNYVNVKKMLLMK